LTITTGCVALLYILYQLVWEARRHSAPLGDDVRKCFFYCGTLTALLWTLYPIAWGVCEGGNVIAPDSEAVFYGILDFLAKPVFGALLIWGHRNIDPARLGLAIRDYDDDPSVMGGTQGTHEKRHAHNTAGATNGHTNGTTNGVTNGVTNGYTNTTTDGTGHIANSTV
jgi:bacteriorhodopsin